MTPREEHPGSGGRNRRGTRKRNQPYILALESEKRVLESEYEYAKKLNKNAKLALEAESILKWQEEQTELLIKQKENAIKNNKRDLQIASQSRSNSARAAAKRLALSPVGACSGEACRSAS